MDIRMPGCDGLTATRLIKAQRPEMKIVMLTTSAEDEDLFEAIKSGACGYLLKSTRGAAFVEALHGLEEGSRPFRPAWPSGSCASSPGSLSGNAEGRHGDRLPLADLGARVCPAHRAPDRDPAPGRRPA